MQFKALDKSVQDRISKSIEKIREKPELGKPLGAALSGYFAERVGGWRIIYGFDEQNIVLYQCRKRDLGY